MRALEERGADVEAWSPAAGASASFYTLTEVPKRLAAEQPDVFHAVCNFNLPLVHPAHTRFVLTVHDLIPLLLPDTVSTAYRLQFRLWLTRSLKVADAVICVSHTTRTALLDAFEVDAERVHVVHHGVDHVERVPQPDAISVKWLDALGLGDFVLYAGALDARKNVERVVEACVAMNVRLVLAGQRWFGGGAIEKRIALAREGGADIRHLGYLPDPLFYALMRRARVFVFPSLYEGFGLPPLEAMRLGVPTVVSTGGALPEVVGDGALVVPPDDVTALAQAIVRADAALGQRGRKRALEFEWATTAEKTLAAYGATS
ncbi:MAG: glycosyltransferase family 4 protein [Myxococcaceae bacterium]|nr:glycosyltransferase family 4 protein [Myxococcaceae bacterium]